MAKRKAVDESVADELAAENSAEVAEVSAEEQAVAEAARAVADAAAVHAEASADLAEAKAALERAVAAAQVQPEVDKHIYVDLGANDSYELRDAPPGWPGEKPYRLLVDGVNVEHVADHQVYKDGKLAGVVWKYARR